MRYFQATLFALICILRAELGRSDDVRKCTIDPSDAHAVELYRTISQGWSMLYNPARRAEAWSLIVPGSEQLTRLGYSLGDYFKFRVAANLGALGITLSGNQNATLEAARDLERFLASCPLNGLPEAAIPLPVASVPGRRDPHVETIPLPTARNVSNARRDVYAQVYKLTIRSEDPRVSIRVDDTILGTGAVETYVLRGEARHQVAGTLLGAPYGEPLFSSQSIVPAGTVGAGNELLVESVVLRPAGSSEPVQASTVGPTDVVEATGTVESSPEGTTLTPPPPRPVRTAAIATTIGASVFLAGTIALAVKREERFYVSHNPPCLPLPTVPSNCNIVRNEFDTVETLRTVGFVLTGVTAATAVSLWIADAVGARSAARVRASVGPQVMCHPSMDAAQIICSGTW